ncbi:MAG: hypothetical protein L0Y38_02900, partial [Methylococcaceae bacterium]|nr:hypothetical protein [Methylococcaceae bacterium]
QQMLSAAAESGNFAFNIHTLTPEKHPLKPTPIRKFISSQSCAVFIQNPLYFVVFLNRSNNDGDLPSMV